MRHSIFGCWILRLVLRTRSKVTLGVSRVLCERVLKLVVGHSETWIEIYGKIARDRL